MMTARERVMAVLKFEKVDHIPNMEWGGMSGEMIARWRVAGLPDNTGLGKFFGWEGIESIRFGLYDPIPGVSGQGIIEDNDIGTTARDCWGTVSFRPRGKATGAFHVERPGIRTREDWDAVKDMFDPDEPRRCPNQARESDPPLFLPWHTHGPTDYNRVHKEPWDVKRARLRDRTHAVQVDAPSMFGDLKEALGFENYCISLCQDPDLIEEMMETRTCLAEALVPRIKEALDFDILHFWEDIAFTGGPVVSPDVMKRLGVPRYRRVIDVFKRHGGEVISLDSDGDINLLIPFWIDAGVNHIWPLEVNAGVRVEKLRNEYGHAFSMRGGIAKGAIVEGRDAIDRELDRVAPVVQDGGYIPMLDHQIDPATEFDDFCYYMEQKRKLLGVH